MPNDAIENVAGADSYTATRAAISPPPNISCAGAPACCPPPIAWHPAALLETPLAGWVCNESMVVYSTILNVTLDPSALTS